MIEGSQAGTLAEQFGVQDVVHAVAVGLIADNDPGDPSSGDAAFPLFQQAPAGTQVDPGLSLTVTGRPFTGTLDHLAGAKVTLSPVAYDSDGTAQPPGRQPAYIVDFGVSLSVLNLDMIDPDGTGAIPGVVLVLPWLGTSFSPKPVFPASDLSGSGVPLAPRRAARYRDHQAARPGRHHPAGPFGLRRPLPHHPRDVPGQRQGLAE